jgi:MFS transporter, SP family, solute carrier family 2 (facilitated glucose transporter), member 1
VHLQVIEEFIRAAYKVRYSQEIADNYVTLIYSIAVGIFGIGGMIGGISGGFVANRYGR